MSKLIVVVLWAYVVLSLAVFVAGKVKASGEEGAVTFYFLLSLINPFLLVFEPEVFKVEGWEYPFSKEE